MAIAFYYDAPGTPEIYELVSRELGHEQPDGLIMQVVTRTDGGLRHLNVWQSRQQWESFRDTRVRPAVATVLDAMHLPVPAAPPREVDVDLVDIGPLPEPA